MVTDPGLSPATAIAADLQEPGIAYLCSASVTPDRDVPTFYYITDLIRTSDSQELVERRWHEFLVATYPHRFVDNPHATAQCHRLADPTAALNARENWRGN